MRKTCGKKADSMTQLWGQAVWALVDDFTEAIGSTRFYVHNSNFPPRHDHNYSHIPPQLFLLKTPLSEHNFYPVSTGPIIKAATINS